MKICDLGIRALIGGFLFQLVLKFFLCQINDIYSSLVAFIYGETIQYILQVTFISGIII
jgi:uncharacterized membrane protein